MGVAYNVPIPFTFGATTVLFFNRECEVSKSFAKVMLVDNSTFSLLTMQAELIHAFATVPVELLGFPVDPPQLPPLVPFNPDPVGPPQDRK